MPAPKRRQIAQDVSGLIAREFASGIEYHRGKGLIHVLPSIADDDILAQTLRPYLENRDEVVRGVAFEALSRGHGPAVDKLVMERIQLNFDKLPSLPYKPTDEESARSTRTDSIAFVYCLEELLRSDSNSARDVGARCLALFRSRYSGSIEGQQIVEAIEQELTRAGLPIDSAAPSALSEPKSPPAVRTAPTPAFPTATPAPLPAPTVAQTPAAGVEHKSPLWPWLVGMLALVVIVAVALKRRA